MSDLEKLVAHNSEAQAVLSLLNKELIERVDGKVDTLSEEMKKWVRDLELLRTELGTDPMTVGERLLLMEENIKRGLREIQEAKVDITLVKARQYDEKGSNTPLKDFLTWVKENKALAFCSFVLSMFVFALFLDWLGVDGLLNVFKTVGGIFK